MAQLALAHCIEVVQRLSLARSRVSDQRMSCCSAVHRPALTRPPASPAALAYFEDNRVAMWLVFSDVWNAIVEVGGGGCTGGPQQRALEIV